MTGEVCHFEIPATNVARAQKFYQQAFGWKTAHIEEMHYTLLQTGPIGKDGRPKEKGVINGGMAKKTKDFPSIVVTLYVEDVDDALAKVRKCGGKAQGETFEIPGMGRGGYFKDTEGNLVGLFQPTR